MQRTEAAASTRLAKVVRHVVAGAEKTKEERSFTDANAGFSEDARAEHRQRVMKLPRMSKDLATWSSSELIHRAQAMGASDDTIASLVDAADTKALLVDLVQSLEPPPASSEKPAFASVNERSSLVFSAPATKCRTTFTRRVEVASVRRSMPGGCVTAAARCTTRSDLMMSSPLQLPTSAKLTLAFCDASF